MQSYFDSTVNARNTYNFNLNKSSFVDGSLPRNRKYSHNSSSSNNNSPRITSFTRSDEKIKQKVSLIDDVV